MSFGHPLSANHQQLTMDSRRPIYSIIIPAYNEGSKVAPPSKRCWPTPLSRPGMEHDRGRRRDCATTLRKLFAVMPSKNPRMRLLENPGNRGKGYSVRNGMVHAQGEILLFSDADLSSPIEEAEKLFAAIENGADVAIGSRWLQSELQTQRQSLHRQLFGRVFNLLLRIILALILRIRSAALKPSRVAPPKESSCCKASNVGASIPNCFIWRTSSNLKWLRFR